MRGVLGLVLMFLVLLALPPTPVLGNPKVPSLCDLHYPSDYLYEWRCVRITPRDTPGRLFGKYWKDGLRFNRMDRRHFVAGMSIKVPKKVRELKDFNPMPAFYQEAQLEPRFILIDQNEMFLGAYEYGNLVFSTPVAVGSDGYRLKNGYYQVDAVDLHHESSLYLVEGTNRPYPMHYALRIYTEKRSDGWTTYWLHGRDIPGYAASHGCIGLYDEEMQKEYYKEPQHPILMDAKRLYQWVVGDEIGSPDFQTIQSGPRVLIMGEPPLLPEPEGPLQPGAVIPASGRPGQGP